MELRLSKALSDAGIASRRKAEEIIFAGRVQVNGAVITVPQHKVNPGVDKIKVNGRPIGSPKKVYYIVNKPKGYVCSHKRMHGEHLVYDLFSTTERLFSLGRLDKDTTGLLIVTNDGDFAQQVIHPNSNVDKEYLVKTEEEISHVHLKKIQGGCDIMGQWVKPHRVTKVRNATLKIVVKEGKKHEVRELVRQAGLTLTELTRVRIGSLNLGKLPEGVFRPLTAEERKTLC